MLRKTLAWFYASILALSVPFYVFGFLAKGHILRGPAGKPWAEN